MALLADICRFGLVTAEQLTRLHVPTPHGLRSMQRRLKRLVEAGLLLRLRAPPDSPLRIGPARVRPGRAGPGLPDQPGDRGAGVLIGVPVYFRPGEEHERAHNPLYMAHTLAVTEVLISAAVLAREVAAVSLRRLRTERELKHQPLRVAPDPTVPARTVAVIPDAWFQLHVAGVGTYSIALELDRGTEHVSRWTRKAQALAAWATGPYRTAFDTDNLTIAIATPAPARRDELADWIFEALTARGQPELAGLFLLTGVDVRATTPEELFFRPHWHQPGAAAPTSLLQPLPAASGVVFAPSP